MTTNATRTKARSALRLARLTVLSALLPVAACESVQQDDLIIQGGTSPDPTAVLEGSILYSGPAPKCTTDIETGKRRVAGNVVLMLYLYDNPPYPEGSAISSENLLIVSGDQLFSVDDCLPDNAKPSFDVRIARSVPFRWPGVALKDRAASYQIRGFFDYDEDLIPMFFATRMPTAGDIMGAALNDVQNTEQGLQEIKLPARVEALKGHVSRGIGVAIGSPIWTERPAFKLSDHRKLSASAPFDVVLGEGLVPDRVATLRKFRGLTCPGGKGDGVSCGLSIDPITASEAAAFNKLDVTLDVNDATAYSFYVQKVDINTINPDAADKPGPDQLVDPHPILGGLGVDWYSPILMLSRLAGSPLEASAGIPLVRLLGSVVLDAQPPASALPFGRGGVPMAVPPVAVVELRPNRRECAVPYFPPGTPGPVIEGRVAQCAELPTGRYAATVVNGLMGERASGDPLQLGKNTLMSGQSWTTPNELGDPVQVNEPIASQGEKGVMLVHTPSDRPGTCAGQPAELCPAGPAIDPGGSDTYVCMPADCCNDVAHLCGLPLCDTVTIDGVPVRKGPDSLKPGATPTAKSIPNCVPFEIPKLCCNTRSQRKASP